MSPGHHRGWHCLLRSLDLTGPLLLGGVPNLPEDFPVQNRQFVGCMRNLSIDGRNVDMAGFIANNGTRAGTVGPGASRGCGGHTTGRAPPTHVLEDEPSCSPVWGPAACRGDEAVSGPAPEAGTQSRGLEQVTR